MRILSHFYIISIVSDQTSIDVLQSKIVVINWKIPILIKGEGEML